MKDPPLHFVGEALGILYNQTILFGPGIFIIVAVYQLQLKSTRPSVRVCLGVCVSVCLSVCVHDNSKIMVQST